MRGERMMRALIGALLLSALAVLSDATAEDHEELPRKTLDDLASSIDSWRESPTVHARRLQQSWTQFNNYFSGTPGAASPLNLPTYYGQLPGPCNGETTRKDASNRCFARICKMPSSIRQIQICFKDNFLLNALLGCGSDTEVQDYFNCDDCNSWPGKFWLWNTDAGNIHIGGIYLDVQATDSSDTVAPPFGFATSPTPYQSEVSFRNEFRVIFTLNEVGFDVDTRVDIQNLQLKKPITLGLSRDNVGVTLRKSDQPITSSQHAVSFQTVLYFRANRFCKNNSPATPGLTGGDLINYDTTCVYRSDKLRSPANPSSPKGRDLYYRPSNPGRTESFLEGVVYDINLPRTGARSTWATNTAYDATACQFDFNNKYASFNKNGAHKTELGLWLDIGPLCSFCIPFIGCADVCQYIVNAILNIVVDYIIKDILCQVITGMFFISDNGSPTSTRGALNLGILNIYNFLKGYVETPLSTKKDAETLEDVTIPDRFTSLPLGGYVWPHANCAVTSYCPYPPAVNFNTSETFKAVSLGINNILGNVSTTPEYYAQNKLTIVEVIDILTGNKDGILKLGYCPPGLPPPTCTLGECAGTCDGDIKAELKLDDYPRFSWTDQSIFNGQIELNGMLFRGINSITRLHILDNGFADAQDTTPDYTHTLKNSFDMTKMSVEAKLNILLTDGSWVHRPRYTVVPANKIRAIPMNTLFFVELSNIKVDIDMFMLLRPDLISDKKIGGVLGNYPDGHLTDRVRCAAFAVDAVQLPKLQVAGSLTGLELNNFFGDLATVVQSGKNVFNLGYFQATNLYLTFLSDNWIRPKVNDYLWTNTYDNECGAIVNGKCSRPHSLDYCPPTYNYYFSNTDPNRYINFYDSKVWNLIKNVVNDVVGGIPVRTGAASINTIIDKYLDWYIPLANLGNVTMVKLPNNPSSNPALREMGNVDVLSSSILIQADVKGTGNPDADKYIQLSNFGIRNLETVHELSIRPTSQANPRNFRLDVKIGGGKIYDRIPKVYIQNGLLGLKFHLNMEVTETTNGQLTTYTQDEADIFMQFGNLTIGTDIYALLNQNEFLDLTYGNLLDLACLLALVDSFDMQTLTIGFQQFGLKITRVGPGGVKWRTRDRFCANTPWISTPCLTPPCAFPSTFAPRYGAACLNSGNAVVSGVSMRFSDALDHLAWEADTWGPVVNNMIQYFFNGIASTTRAAVNSFVKKQIDIVGCEKVSVFSGSPLGFLDRLLNNATVATDGFFAWYEQLSKDQWNPRFPKVDRNNPIATMVGSQPGDINYALSPTVFRPMAGFPAALCNKIGTLKDPYYKTLNDSCWEDRVKIPHGDKGPIDVRNSFIVSEVQSFLSKSGQKVLLEALNAIATTQGNPLGDFLISYPTGTALPDSRGTCTFTIPVTNEPSYCIDLDVNLTSLNFPTTFSNDVFIPGLQIALRRLKILNFHTFDASPNVFELLKPYIPDQYNFVSPRDQDARFTLANRVKFTGASFLQFSLEVDVSVAEKFVKLNSLTPEKPVTDTLKLDFQLKDWDIQFMLQAAINSTRLAEVPFYYVLDPFNIENCFFSVFYENGLMLPQFQMYVSDIIGPNAVVSAKSPSGSKPNIFSSGMADIITASLEIIFQLIKEDLPDATQGKGREYINRVLDGYVVRARDANNCPPPTPCGPPESMCHYVNFLDDSFTPILNTINSVVGGNPITTSQIDINALIELGLNYTFFSPTGPQLAGSQNVKHPAVGDWFLPAPLAYTNGPSSVKITNLGLKGLDTIYKLVLGTIPGKEHSLSFAIEIGNGTMKDGSKQPAQVFKADPLVVQAEFDLIVKATRPGHVIETLADNQFRVELVFSSINLTSIQEILVNKTDLFLLNVNQISKTQCALSVIDKVTMQTVSMQIADFDVNIPNNACPSSCPAPGFGRNPNSCGGKKCNIGLAIDQLRTEAIITNAVKPPQSSVPLSMINAIFNNIASSAATGFNKIDIWNKPRENCDIPRVIFSILSGVRNATHAQLLVDRLVNNVTGIVKFPLPQIKPDYSSITVQSLRAGDSDDRPFFVAEVIQSALDALGPKPAPSVILKESSICAELKLPIYLTPLCDQFAAGTTNFSAKLVEWTTQQPNLIEEGRSPLNIEGRVRFDSNKDKYYDVRASKFVSSISAYFDKNSKNLNTLLKDVSNKTTILRPETDGSVTLIVNMTEAIFWVDANIIGGQTCDGSSKDASFQLQDILGTSNLFIPSLRILPGNLEIRNFGSFTEVVLLKPYFAAGVGARFTTQHELGWRDPAKPLNVTLSVDMFYDAAFRTGGHIPSGIEEKETINITMSAQDLLIQALTLLAVDLNKLGETRLGDFLTVTETQEFNRNCKAVTCLMGALFDGGLYIPQLTINATNIIGPRFKTSGRLFSQGMELLLDALFELVVQLFRDDLPALTQGPLRDLINDQLVTTLNDAKADGACPPRKNYTLTYPKGQYYCSHNDTTGDSPLLTQNKQICQSKGTGKLCTWAPPDGVITETTVACFYSTESKVLNFKTARGLQQLKNFINGSLMNEDSALYVNNYLSAFAKSVSTDLYEKDGIPLKYNGKDYGTINVGIGKFTVTGLDTIDRMQVFDPAPFAPGGDSAWTNPSEYEKPAARLLLNAPDDFDEDDMPMAVTTSRRDLAIKQNFAYADNKYMSRTAFGWTGPLSFYFEVLYAFDELFVPRADGPTDFVENHVSVKIILYDFDFAVDLYMLVNIPRLMDLQVRSIGTIYELPCILAIFEPNGLVPTRANITYGSVGFELNCVNRCDSPFFAPLSKVGFSDQASVNLRTSFTNMFKRVTDFLIKLLASSDAQKFLDRQISISNERCEAIKAGIPLPEATPSSETDAASAMGIAGLASLFATFVGFALLVPVHFRRRDELMKRALLDAHSRGTAGKSKDEFELAERRLKSAFDHPMMPKVVKFGLPFWILVNIIMFATANFAAPGAIVELTLSIAGDTTYPITLLPFTLPSSINDMWNAGTYLLALLIALLSGAWPYAKQLLMAFAWFAPSTVLHPNARGRMLEVLDQLGKWSLIDIYVLVMLMVGFRFYLSSSLIDSFSLLPPDVLVVDVKVTPGWGIFGFVLGAIGSLLVNHLMIWHHRKIVRMDEDLQDAILGTLVKDLRTPRIPLSRHRFNILDAEGRPYRYSVAVRVMVVFFLVITFLLLIIGAVVPVIKFQFRGIAGLAISFLDQGLATVTYSVVSIGTSLIQGARSDAGSVLGILFLQILYILFALVIPLVLCVLLIAIWVVPLTLREQLLLYFIAEVLSAWEAVLVLVVALLAAILQISMLAQFIVNNATGNICKSLEGELDKFFPDPSDAKCFDVIASLLPTTSIIFAAAVLLFLCTVVVFRLIHAAMEDRELAMRRKPPHSPGEMSGLSGFIVRRALEAFGASQIANGGSVANLFAQEKGAFDPRDSQLTPANPIMTREMPQSISGMQTQNPMFHGSLGGLSRGTHQSIDV